MKLVLELQKFSRIQLVICLLIAFSFHSKAADYYWVGGTGNWSEVDQHWATTSGGTTFHSIVPTSDDNVIFDANSFDAPGQVVTLDGNFANAKNFDWSGVSNSPTFESSGGTFSIFGSLTFSENMTVSLNSDLEFGGTGNFTITSAGHQLTSEDVDFNSTGATWELVDSLAIGSYMYISQGNFITNGQPITAYQMTQLGPSTVDISNSSIDLAYRWTISGTDANLTTTNSTITAREAELGNGYTYENIVITDDDIEGSGVSIKKLIFENIARISLTNSTVDILEVNGNSTLFNRGNTTYHKATIQSSSIEYIGSNVDQFYDTLILTGNTVTITLSPSTQTINDVFTFAGDCNSFTTIISGIKGEPVIFEIPFDITTDYVAVQDIHVQGGATYTLNNSIDFGGNQGWVINDLTSADLYWIGGTSDEWNDGDNWSLTSGGAPYGCPPTIKDNVYFDANSFSTQASVNITSQAYANNIDWTGALFTPTWESNNNVSLQIGGSVTLIEDMEVDINGNLYFVSCSTGNTITSAGNLLSDRDIYFDCIDGEWQFLDDMEIYGELLLQNGSLIMSNIKGRVGGFIAFDSTSLDIQDADITLNSGYFSQDLSYIWTSFYLGYDVDFESANSIIRNDASIGQARIWTQQGYTFANISMDDNNEFYCDSCFADTVFMKHEYTDLRVFNNSVISKVIVQEDDIDVHIDNAKVGTLLIENLGETSLNPNPTGNRSTIDSLIVQNPGTQLTIGDTLFINTHLDIPSNCSVFTNIVSANEGSTAHIFYEKDVAISYAYIRDIAIGTGSTYTATESIDGGGNSGWDITNLSNKTLYWIGGDGDWNDGNNWSLTSGGAPVGCSPSPLDTAIFDENSFDASDQTVTATTPINVKTLDWSAVTNQPTFDVDGDITIGGSLIYAEDMKVKTRSNYYFSSCEGGNTITTGNNQISNSSISFTCDGDWELQDSLKLSGGIYFSHGSFTTNGNYMGVSYFQVTDSLQLDIRNSYIEVNNNLEMDVNNADLLADSSYIKINRGRFEGGTGYNYWDVEHSYSTVNSYYSISGDYLSFQNVYLTDYSYFHANNSTVGGLHATGSSVTINGNNNTFGIANLNTTVSTTIYKEQTFDTLNINVGGMTLTLESDRTQTIHHEFNIVQTPSFPILLNASTQGSQAHINFSGIKPPCSEFLFLRDSDIYGNAGVPFYAGLDSDDIDNNTGWIFESSADCNTLLCAFEGLELDLGADTVFCQFFDLELDPFDIPVFIQWQSLNDVPIEKDTLNKYRVTETDTVLVTVSTDICALSDTMILTQEECSVVPVYICQGDSALLQSSYSNQNYIWSTSSTDDSIYVHTAGIYWVKVDNGLDDLVDSFEVIVQTPPAFDLGDDTTLCNGAEYTYEVPAAYNSFTWSIGGSSRTYTTDTASTIWLEIENGVCTTRDTIQINTNSVTLSGLGNDTTICPGATLGWNGTLTGLNYLWENGDSGFETVSRTISDSGLYWLEVSSGQCSLRDSIKVSIENVPSASFNFEDTTLCNIGSATLSVGDNYDQYLWSNGETDTSITFNTSGTYWVNVRKGNCVIGDTVDVKLLAVPVFSLGNDTTLCPGDTLSYSVSLSNFNYEWEDGSTGSGLMERDIADSGIYAVTISIEDCKRSDTIVVSLSDISPIEFADDTSFCQGETLDLTIAGNYDSQLWKDGSTSNSLQISTSGNYFVEAQKGHCIVHDTIDVTEDTRPILNLGADTLLCASDSLVIQESFIGNTYTWSTGETGSDQFTTTIKNDGVYWLEIGNGCNARDSITVTFKTDESFDLGSDTTICEGESIELEVASIYDTYTWSGGEATTKIDVNAAAKYTLTTELNDCIYKDSINVFLNPIPVFSLGNDTTVCTDSYQIQANLSADSYKWSTSEVTAAINVTTSGDYWLILEKDGCSFKDTITLSLENTASIAIATDTLVLCEGTTVSYNDTTNFDTYIWSNGSDSSFVETDNPGWLTVSATRGVCTTRDSVFVQKVLNPILIVDTTFEVCDKEKPTVEPYFENGTFAWLDGYSNIDRTLTKAGVYAMEVTNVCASITQEITANEIYCGIVIPIVFTPNGDGVHDYWEFDNLEDYPDLKLKIYNRWGAMIYFTSNYNNDWDGTGMLTGLDVPDGTYYYIIKHDDIPEELIRGEVTIIR